MTDRTSVQFPTRYHVHLCIAPDAERPHARRRNFALDGS